MGNSIKFIRYFKSFENGAEYLLVEIDGEKRMFEALKGEFETEKKDEGTRKPTGC